MKRWSAMSVVVLLALGACDTGMEDQEAMPLPAPTHSFQQLHSHRLRVQPTSIQVREDTTYVFDTGHCGLSYLLDFDGSFWKAIDPNGDKPGPSFLINQDSGTIELLGPKEARYTSSTGKAVQLRRREGPVVVGGCD